ncbi:MAG TPA: quinone oxidoreductase [Burkholderiaceae bacterium]
MSKAIRIEQFGGPEVLQLVDLEVAPPGPAEARVRHAAIGVNFIDVYYRTGLYAQPLPGAIGNEGAGVVEAVGEGVTDLKVGDRVAYATKQLGAYAEVRNMPADLLVRVPDAIDLESAAAMMLKGMTVEYLFRRTFPLQGGETILFHAAAGGVGLIACQWAKALGVTMIGTAGSDEKAQLAKEAGCTHVINYKRENFTQRVRELTNGKGVPVVYDSIGRDTFTGSLDCLAPRGMMVSFGNASGPVEPFGLQELAARGALYVTRPTLFAYNTDRASFQASAGALFAMVDGGKIEIAINHRYALADAASAHRDLEARNTTGSSILLPA